ncbi:hypothetical protein [Natrinema salsiterrestre]|uniref:Uncharacterized protein n=1 Tax=Natrinema salsiterrestre TaxID=2950540 RepID=A0A9Q4L6A9_9EURY|nr:hypothetical protein [Natrinema salsiterrestre]MDF9748402.1 hypothetical protein [Natrinema salsiterrestre]
MNCGHCGADLPSRAREAVEDGDRDEIVLHVFNPEDEPSFVVSQTDGYCDLECASEAVAYDFIETMMGRALAVDGDPSEDRPRSFEHAVRLLVPSEHSDHISEAYEQAIGDDGAEIEAGESA